jgi:hypothetical protein
LVPTGSVDKIYARCVWITLSAGERCVNNFMVKLHGESVEVAMSWRLEETEFGDEGVVYARFSNGGIKIEAVAFIHFSGRVPTQRRLDVLGPGPNTVGTGVPRGLAMWLKEYLDVDELRIEGAARASGAGPGRRPAPLIFR